MPVFDYRARTSEGEPREGEITATGRDEAVAALHQQGLFPSAVIARAVARPATPRGSAPGVASLFRRVPLMTRCAFWRQAAQALDAGFTVHQTLGLLAESGLGQLSGFCQRKLGAAARGAPLSELMAEAPDLFSPIERGLVRAGEASGRLDLQMTRLAQIQEREMEFRNSIRWRLLYLKLVGAAFVLCAFVVGVVAPAIAARQAGGGYSFWGKTFGFVWPLLAVVGGILAVRAVYAGSGATRLAVDRIKLRLPVLGPLFRKLSIARFSRSLGALVGAGLPVGEALELASESAANLHLQSYLLGLSPRVRAGEPFSSVMRETGFFPNQVVQMVRVGEETGRTDEMLAKVSDYYESEVSATTQALAISGFVATIVLAGLLVGLFVARFYLNYYGGLLEMTAE